MRLLLINGDLWRVVRVRSGDPRLIDRTGVETIGTTDPLTRTIHISNAIAPPLLDKVLLHEIAHAATISYDALRPLYDILPEQYRINVEEWAVGLFENYAIEASILASESLGRPVCVNGFCIEQEGVI